MTSQLVFAVLAVVVAVDDPALADALAQRDAFELEAGASTLEAALKKDGEEGAVAAQRLWHLGVLLAEARDAEGAKAAFAKAAATGIDPVLAVEVAPAIRALIDDALANAPASTAPASATNGTGDDEQPGSEPERSLPNDASDAPSATGGLLWLAAGGTAASAGALGLVGGAGLVTLAAAALGDPSSLRDEKDGAETLAWVGGLAAAAGGVALLGGGILVGIGFFE